MSIENFKRINIVIFIYELIRLSMLPVDIIAYIISEDLGDLVEIIYRPLYILIFEKSEMFFPVMMLITLILCLEALIGRRLVKKGLSEKFYHYIKAFAVMSVVLTWLYYFLLLTRYL